MQYPSETELRQAVETTCEALRRDARVTIRIAPLNGETHWEGGINGHFFRIPTGVLVEVPESLALLIAAGERVRVESAARLDGYRRSGGKRIG